MEWIIQQAEEKRNSERSPPRGGRSDPQRELSPPDDLHDDPMGQPINWESPAESASRSRVRGARHGDGVGGHREPDGSEHSAVSSYLTAHSKLSRDHLVGTAHRKLSRDHLVGTAHSKLSRDHLVGTAHSQTAESREFEVVTRHSSNSPTLLNEVVTRESRNSPTLLLSGSEKAAGDNAVVSKPSVSVSSGNEFYETCYHKFSETGNNEFSETGIDAFTSTQKHGTTGSSDVCAGEMQPCGEFWKGELERIPSSISRCVSNASNARSSFQSFHDLKSDLSTTTIASASLAGLAERDLPHPVSTLTERDLPHPVSTLTERDLPHPVSTQDVSSSFGPLRESLSCSYWNPDAQSRGVANSTVHSFRDIEQDVSHFSPVCRSTPFQAQTRGSGTDVTPVHVRSVFCTMTPDEVNATSGKYR